MTMFRRDENGAAMPMAIALAFLLTFSIAVLSVFVVTGVQHETYSEKQNKFAVGQDAAFDEILGKINTENKMSGATYYGSANKKTTSDGMYEWYVTGSAAPYVVVMKPTAASGMSTDANSEIRRNLVSKPVKSIYPAANSKTNSGDPSMVYEPLMENGMFGYFQSSFHSYRLGTVDQDTERGLVSVMGGDYQQVLNNTKMLSYDSASGTVPSTSTGKGTWTTSLNFVDPTKSDPNETITNVTADKEKFVGVNRTILADNNGDPRPAANCSGCVRGDRQYYSYDMSYDQVDNDAIAKCGNATRNWRSSVNGTIFNPVLDGSSCWNEIVFDRNTTVVANTSDIVYAKNIVVEQNTSVNRDKRPSNLRLVSFGTGGITMKHGSSVSGLIMGLGQKSCNISGVGGLPANVYGSLVCTNAYTINGVNLWWDTSLESSYLNQTFPSTSPLSRMWEYAN